MKCIPIPSCRECPSRDHKGGFGTIAYVPVCRRTNRELPYTLGSGHRGRVIAVSSDEIPDWCPLPDTEDCI